MSLQSLLDTFEQYVYIAPWLQFVGLMLGFGGLLGNHHWFGIPLAYLGFGISMAGFVYHKIYPGNLPNGRLS